MDCPNCGAPVPPKAKACPECGSDDETGWPEAAESSGLNLPDEEEFNYNEFVSREFGEDSPKPRNITWLWWVVAIVLILVFIVLMLKR